MNNLYSIIKINFKPELNVPVVDNETKPEEKPAEQKTEQKPVEKPVQKPVEELPAPKPEEPVKPEEPAKKPETKVAMETIANQMVETTGVEFRMPFAMPIEAERSTEFIGLSQADFEKYVTDSTALESMIMPSNYSLCIIKINDTTYTQNSNHKTVLFTTHIFSIPYVPLLIKSVYF